MYAAHRLFESYNAAPKIFVEGKDFFIDELAGCVIGKEPHLYNDPRVKFTLVLKDDEHRLIFD